jgi:hypothetical protein
MAPASRSHLVLLKQRSLFAADFRSGRTWNTRRSQVQLRFLGWKFFPFGLRKILQLLFRHGFRHFFGRAFQTGLWGFSSLDGQGRACGHLLFF